MSSAAPLIFDRAAATFIGAAITAIVAILLWIGNKWWDRRVEHAQRALRIQDVERALHAEISAHLHQLEMDDLLTHKTAMVERISGDAGFIPLVPKQTHAMIFEAMVQDIQILPEATITPVTLYYGQIRSVADFAEEFRTEAYAQMDADRRADMYADFMDMKMMSFDLGRKAIREIERSYVRTSGARIGVNNRVSVLSGRPGEG